MTAIELIQNLGSLSGAGGHLLWLEEVRRPPPPSLLTSACAQVGRPCFSSSDVFFFWAAFLSISLLASVFPVSLPLFFLFLRPCLIHARLPEGGRAFVHGHTFLHSWTHFLAFMDTLSCIHGHTFLHSWTHFLAFMDTLSCIHGHTFLHSWTHFLAFMEWADDGGNRPAAWSYVPVQSSFCSLCVFYRTLAVGKDAY